MKWFKSQLRKDIEKMLVNQAGLEADVTALGVQITALAVNVTALETAITSGEGAPAQLDDTSLQAAITNLTSVNTAITGFLAGQPPVIGPVTVQPSAKPAQVASSIKAL